MNTNNNPIRKYYRNVAIYFLPYLFNRDPGGLDAEDRKLCDDFVDFHKHHYGRGHFATTGARAPTEIVKCDICGVLNECEEIVYVAMHLPSPL